MDDKNPTPSDAIDQKALNMKIPPPGPLDDFEQVIYDKMRSGEIQGERYNPKTGNWEPFE